MPAQMAPDQGPGIPGLRLGHLPSSNPYRLCPPMSTADAILPTPPIAFIGGGNMGSAIIHGLMNQDNPPQITVCDPHPGTRERHAAAGLQTADTAAPAASASVIVLAVKPQLVDAVLDELRPLLTGDHLVVSILAGTTTTRLADGLADGVRIIRSMPNTRWLSAEAWLASLVDRTPAIATWT